MIFYLNILCTVQIILCYKERTPGFVLNHPTSIFISSYINVISNMAAHCVFLPLLSALTDEGIVFKRLKH